MDYDYPFYYRNYYRPVRKVPVPVHRETKPTPKPERKVIHVPVMDGSEIRSRGLRRSRSRSREESAVMIQKVMRGFLVRKTVKKIAAIKTEVDEMENRIMSEETMELIMKDKKERLKVNEMLMRILLKLDSVPGVDFGVRDYRKSVIKKAIRLQEVVDSISDHQIQTLDRNGTVSQSDPNSNPNSLSNNADQKLELQNNVESQKNSESDVPEAMNVEAVPEIEGNIAKSASESNLNSISNSVDVNQKLESQYNVESQKSEDRDIPEVEEKEEAPEIIEGNIAKSASESNSNSQVNTLDRNEELTENMEEEDDESQTGSSADPDRDMIIEGEEDSNCEISDEKRLEKKNEEEGRNAELLKKLVDENEKMMGLMADLFKKNEMQTKLLSSLSHRVEHLERALMCEIFRRKKKRNGTCS